uniref:Uncharacterized protein n=1 Tax=Sphaerodactylus townsendi TaxID=933632 RepID=A0ACB8FDP3_9SAUR
MTVGLRAALASGDASGKLPQQSGSPCRCSLLACGGIGTRAKHARLEAEQASCGPAGSRCRPPDAGSGAVLPAARRGSAKPAKAQPPANAGQGPTSDVAPLRVPGMKASEDGRDVVQGEPSSVRSGFGGPAGLTLLQALQRLSRASAWLPLLWRHSLRLYAQCSWRGPGGRSRRAMTKRELGSLKFEPSLDNRSNPLSLRASYGFGKAKGELSVHVQKRWIHLPLHIVQRGVLAEETDAVEKRLRVGRRPGNIKCRCGCLRSV